MAEVTVIDYGIGNLLSVSRALEHCGAVVTVTSDPRLILAAKRVVLPGVGAFTEGMAAIRANGLDIVLCQVAARGVPLLGICLGMQILFDQSEEFGVNEGLGLIPGRVVPIPAKTSEGLSQKIPHVGWNEIGPPEHKSSWQKSIFAEISTGESVYFVHSFMSVPTLYSHRLADCTYGGIKIAAAVQRDNIFGCQFHPEKSGLTGLKILRNFLLQ